MRLRRLEFSDPGLAALKSAARAAIIMPAVFAVAYQVIRQPQTAIFASFGSFAILVFADFSGSPRSRLTAYLSLAATGAVLVVAGTLCSRNAWLAAAAMAAVGFVILFAGVINGYFAAGATAAILPFVVSVSIPAPLSAIPWRLAGWGLAAGAGTCAVMLLWPPRRSGTLRADAAASCVALADLADCALSGEQQAISSRIAAAREAVDGLRRRFQGTPHRPTGPTGQAAALAALIDELGWLLGSLEPVAASPMAELCQAENGEAMAAAAAVLRASGARLAGRDVRPDTGRLEQAQDAVVVALATRISQLSPAPADEVLESLLGRSFRTRAISYATRQIAGYALAASGAALDSADGAPGSAARRLAPLPAALLAMQRFAAEHANPRSVAFRASIRGAAGLAVAVFIAQRSGLQHSFWVVLGTLSVLRSNALGTGRSILSALAGTAAGIVVGAAILLAVGVSAPVLWGVLPVAVLVAAYAPRVISFAAGQAAFTVVLVVLFNIIQPVGWQVGLIRIEDVAIGFAVSLGVGLVFWPRGAATVLRENMAAAYSRSADYVAVTAQLLASRDEAGDPGRAGQAAAAAVHRLDDAFRQYLAERSTKRLNPESAARLVMGPARVLRVGRSMAALTGTMAALTGTTAGDRTKGTSEINVNIGRYGESLDEQVQALRSWYVALGDSLANGTSVPLPQSPDTAAHRIRLQYLRDSISSGEPSALREALLVLWAGQHLDMLRILEAHLGEQAIASGMPPGG
jgi:uncharacterized membrane protein YccC